MISDQQRGLRGQSLPTGGLEPEVVLAESIPHRLLSAHQCLVGAIEGVFGSGGDPLADQALNPTRGPALGGLGFGYGSRVEGRPAVVRLLLRSAWLLGHRWLAL